MTRCPEQGWLYALKYVALVNNWMVNEKLGWETLYFKQYGTTLDISAIMAYQFYQPIYYLDLEESFPDSKEKSCYLLGMTENVGDQLIYWILTYNKQSVIARSVL